MNSFYEHHKDNIHWHYRCFDRILLNGLIQPFQQPERVVGFFNTYRQLYPVTRYTLRDIADEFQRWVTERAEKRKCAVPERLQELANSLTPRDLVTCGQKWLAHLTPFFNRKRTRACGLPAPAVLLASRVLRQPHLPSSCGTG